MQEGQLKMDSNKRDFLIVSCIVFFMIGFIFLLFYVEIGSNEADCKEYNLEYNFTYKEIKYNLDKIILPNNKSISCVDFVEEIHKKNLEAARNESKSKIEDLRRYIK